MRKNRTLYNTKTKLDMETEKIISTIKEQIGTTDFSDRTIGKYVELNPVSEGQEPDENYFKRGAEFFKSMQGQYNADFSTKLNAKVDEFKKSYKPEKKVSENPLPNVATENNGNDTRYQELMEKYNKMEERLNEKEKAEAQQIYKKNLSDSFKAAIEEKGLVYDPIYYRAIELEHGDFDTKKDVGTSVNEIIPKYEKMFSDVNRDGALPFRGGSGSGSKEGNRTVDDFFARKAAEEGWQKAD
jgi:hypothetical protein